jgi:putative transposase
MFASDIRKRRVSAMRQFRHGRWHLDEMVVRVNGEHRYLWRAVDHEGEMLESYVTKRRDRKAALKFMRKALKRHGKPEEIVTDGLRSYRAVMLAQRRSAACHYCPTRFAWRTAICHFDDESGQC